MAGTNVVFTRKNHPVDEVMSALQKAIRRGQVQEAIYWALEYHAYYHKAIWTGRFLTYLHEDIGLASPATALYVDALRQYALALPDAGKGETGQTPVAYAAMAMARAPKSRRAVSCHLLVYEDDFSSQYEVNIKSLQEVENVLGWCLMHGDELESVYWASIMETEFRGKTPGYQQVWNLLEVCAIAGQTIHSTVLAYVQMCKRHYMEFVVAGKPENLCLINAALAVARAPRETFSFKTLNPEVEGIDDYIKLVNSNEYRIDVPDEALDKHTVRGKNMKRGIVHFQEVGARLENEAVELDPDKERAYKHGRNSTQIERYLNFKSWLDTNRPRQQGNLFGD